MQTGALPAAEMGSWRKSFGRADLLRSHLFVAAAVRRLVMREYRSQRDVLVGKERSMNNPIEEQIRLRAHELWEAAGKPKGQEDAFWYQAEREIKDRAANNADEKSNAFLQ